MVAQEAQVQEAQVPERAPVNPPHAQQDGMAEVSNRVCEEQSGEETDPEEPALPGPLFDRVDLHV